MNNRVDPERVAAGLLAGATDEILIVELASGRQEALGPLYARYAGLIFHLATQRLDRAVAEELVQEVFLTVWRTAGAFDPAQGAFRPWLMRLAQWRILNEYRRTSRRPQAKREPDGAGDEPFEHMPDHEPGPEERAWRKEHGQIVHSALEDLPPKQREAVALAFLQEMTHEQVASTLDVPLGTAKTRIRSGLALLRLRLGPVAASLLAISLALVGVRSLQTQMAYERDERALSLVTTSELTPLRLVPVAPDVPGNAHANYRARTGSNLVVLTGEALPTLPAGQTYQAWARHGQTWTSLGTFMPDANGNARLIAEDPALSTAPDSVVVSIERTAGSATPTGAVVLAWGT
jgi:RNA polymerase sigma-70 factor, ECF subfamily